MDNDDLLIDAVHVNDVARVNALLASGLVDVNARVAAKRNAPVLSLAANLGHVEIVERLLDAGALIDEVDDEGNSACHAAVEMCRFDVVELLIARNADVMLENESIETPIVFATYTRCEQLVLMLVEAALAAGTLDDDAACEAGTVSPAVISALSDTGIDFGAIRYCTGDTLLHRALDGCGDFDASMLKCIIEVAGVDINARNERGRTAAHDASAMHSGDKLAHLVAAGADPDVADENGCTPLHRSQLFPSVDIADLLLGAGANVHARNNGGRTACHGACESSHASLPALLAFGADLDEPDNGGVTPRQLLNDAPVPTPDEIALARRRVVSVQVWFVRERAFDVCVGLQSLRFDALCMCEILMHSCGPVAPFIPFHIWWQIATTVKHFRRA